MLCEYYSRLKYSIWVHIINTGTPTTMLSQWEWFFFFWSHNVIKVSWLPYRIFNNISKTHCISYVGTLPNCCKSTLASNWFGLPHNNYTMQNYPSEEYNSFLFESPCILGPSRSRAADFAISEKKCWSHSAACQLSVLMNSSQLSFVGWHISTVSNHLTNMTRTVEEKARA